MPGSFLETLKLQLLAGRGPGGKLVPAEYEIGIGMSLYEVLLKIHALDTRDGKKIASLSESIQQVRNHAEMGILSMSHLSIILRVLEETNVEMLDGTTAEELHDIQIGFRNFVDGYYARMMMERNK